MRILNLHGFGGSSENTSYRMIRQVSPSSEIVSEAIDYLNTSPKAIIEKSCKEGAFDIVVGNSFGGFLAYIIGTRLKIKTVLTNPCVPPAGYILNLVKWYRYTDELVELWDKYRGKNENCHVLLGRQDEVLDPHKTYRLLSGNCVDIAWTNGGHVLCEEDIDYWFEEKISQRFEFVNDGGIKEQLFEFNGVKYSISKVFSDFEDASNDYNWLADEYRKLIEKYVWTCSRLVIDELGIFREIELTDNHGGKSTMTLNICIEDYFSDEDYRKEVLFDFCDGTVEGLLGWWP